MLLGYLYIVLAATCWGGSAVAGKYLFNSGEINAVTVSQARVTFSWMMLSVVLVLWRRASLRVAPRDLWQFLLLGMTGIAGANFLLYYAFELGMDVAVADLIQFTAPLMVVVWMWLRGHEPLDRAKVIAVLLSLLGSALVLGLFRVGGSRSYSTAGAVSAILSAICYAFLIVYGKHLSRKYALPTYLYYGLAAATIFWAVMQPPWVFVEKIGSVRMATTMVAFAVVSVLLPYVFFFLGLKRVQASRAGIVSTFEPVMITVTAWVLLGESLSPSQVVGILLVLGAIVIVELFNEPAEQ